MRLNGGVTDGIAISADKMTLNESTFEDQAENNATRTHDAVAIDSGQKMDGSDMVTPIVWPLAITSDPGDDDPHGFGDAIEVQVALSEDVTKTGPRDW